MIVVSNFPYPETTISIKQPLPNFQQRHNFNDWFFFLNRRNVDILTYLELNVFFKDFDFFLSFLIFFFDFHKNKEKKSNLEKKVIAKRIHYHPKTIAENLVEKKIAVKNAQFFFVFEGVKGREIHHLLNQTLISFTSIASHYHLLE